jgi:predicted acyl esterase
MTNGLTFFDEGHELQFERLWHLLRPDRTRFVLGQWGHGGTREGFNVLAVEWFDHYLRGGPDVDTGVVEYQSESHAWHTTSRWPPASRKSKLYLSGDQLVSSRERVERSARTFLSADADTALDLADVLLESPSGGPSAPLVGNVGPACGPHQVLYVSPPLAEDVLVAGNFRADLSLTNTLPGGNLVATLYHTPGDASCADLLDRAEDAGRVQLDLRHWAEPGASRPFPVGRRVRVAADSLPLATEIPAGSRLVLAVGAGSAEIEPDPLKPAITISTGSGVPGSLTLPVVEGRLGFRPEPAG